LGQPQEFGLVLRAEHLNDVRVYNLAWSFRLHRHPPTDSRPLELDSRLVWFIPDFPIFFQIAARSALRHAKYCSLTKNWYQVHAGHCSVNECLEKIAMWIAAWL
jgi:hypothetical protein